MYPLQLDARNARKVAGSAAALPLSLFHLSHLLRAGVSLSDALLDVISEEPRRQMSRVWADIRSRVEEGKTLSDALQAWPRVFAPVVVAMVRAGEASGHLAESCETVQQLLLWQSAVKARLITVLIYPCFALIVMLLAIGFLFVTVVPSMQIFLGNAQSPLAWHTSALLYFSRWLGAYLVPIVCVLLLVLVAIAILRFLLPVVRFSCDRIQLQLPVVGRLVAELALSRYAKTCSRLYGSGVSLEESLRVSESVVENTVLCLELSRIRHMMLAGVGLGQSIQSAQFVPNSFKRLLAVGESSAVLEHAMLQASEHLQRNAEHSIDRIERLIGPVLLLVIGVNLLWIVTSVLAPVYDAAITAVMSS